MEEEVEQIELIKEADILKKLPEETKEKVELPVTELAIEEDEENKKKIKDKEESKETKQHNSYSTPVIDAQVLYEAYKNRHRPSYQNVEVVLYSYQVPWFATAMTDGNKIWFGPRMEFYDPHPNDRLYHELSHWRISTPYGTELDVETMAQLQLPRLNTVSVSYKV